MSFRESFANDRVFKLCPDFDLTHRRRAALSDHFHELISERKHRFRIMQILKVVALSGFLIMLHLVLTFFDARNTRHGPFVFAFFTIKKRTSGINQSTAAYVS